MDLYQPIDKDAAQVPFKALLVIHIFWVWHGRFLKLLQILEDFHDILRHHQRIVIVLCI